MTQSWRGLHPSENRSGCISSGTHSVWNEVGSAFYWTDPSSEVKWKRLKQGPPLRHMGRHLYWVPFSLSPSLTELATGHLLLWRFLCFFYNKKVKIRHFWRSVLEAFRVSRMKIRWRITIRQDPDYLNAPLEAQGQAAIQFFFLFHFIYFLLPLGKKFSVTCSFSSLPETHRWSRTDDRPLADSASAAVDVHKNLDGPLS